MLNYLFQNCDGSFSTASSLKRHQKRIHDTGKKFDCKYCPEVFYNIESFRSHQNEQHSDIWKPRQCTQCGQMLDTKTMARQHRSAHSDITKGSGTIINNTCCIFCGEKFDTLKQYLSHKYEHLQCTKEELKNYGIDGVYPCKVCGSVFSSLNNLVAHLASHMEKSYTCEICDKKYSYYDFKKHVKMIHTKVECNLCSKVFQGKLPRSSLLIYLFYLQLWYDVSKTLKHTKQFT